MAGGDTNEHSQRNDVKWTWADNIMCAWLASSGNEWLYISPFSCSRIPHYNACRACNGCEFAWFVNGPRTKFWYMTQGTKHSTKVWYHVGYMVQALISSLWRKDLTTPKVEDVIRTSQAWQSWSQEENLWRLMLEFWGAVTGDPKCAG